MYNMKYLGGAPELITEELGNLFVRLRPWGHRPYLSIMLPEQQISPRFATSLSFAVRDHNLAVTEKGYACLVPRETRPGDTVCALLGMLQPYILRGSSTCPGIFRIVGPCYIHGIMNGGSIRRPKVSCHENSDKLKGSHENSDLGIQGMVG